MRDLVRRIKRRLTGGPAVETPGGEKPADFYDRLYRQSESYRSPYLASHYYFLWTVIADRLRRSGLRRVLEVGCGPGQLAAMLFDLGIVDAYAGLDFSAEAVALARANAPAGEWEVGDARTTTLHGRFDHDAVVCTEVLEHVEDDEAVVLRFSPGKRCLFTVPSFPYESHVRHFKDAGAVAARYGRYFDGLDVAHYRSPRCRDDLFFLGDGVTKAPRGGPVRPGP